MKYYQDLAKLQCFTRSDVNNLTNNYDAADSLIYSYKKKGYIDSVRRNLYVVISLETNHPIANRYKIASSITSNAYISHHTALEYYGCANQVYHEVYVSSGKKFNSFRYDDITYTYIAPRINSGIELKENDIKVTSIERTILDCINDFEKIGGLEELLRSLPLIPYTSEKKLLYLLKEYNKQFLYQKTGYILSHYKKELQLSEEFFTNCKKHIVESVRYLYKDLKFEKHEYDNEWKLVTPISLLDITKKGGYIDAKI